MSLSQSEIIHQLEKANKGLSECLFQMQNAAIDMAKQIEGLEFQVTCMKNSIRRFDESSKGKDWRRREKLERLATAVQEFRLVPSVEPGDSVAADAYEVMARAHDDLRFDAQLGEL